MALSGKWGAIMNPKLLFSLLSILVLGALLSLIVDEWSERLPGPIPGDYVQCRHQTTNITKTP